MPNRNYVKPFVLRWYIGLIAALIVAATSSGAWADSVGIATGSSRSPVYQIGLAIAKAARNARDLDVRPRPYKSTTQGSIVVNSGSLEFGLESITALNDSMNGNGKFAGKPLTNLALVARLVPFRVTIGVRANSGIASGADLAGN